jgi:hypothetical protein
MMTIIRLWSLVVVSSWQRKLSVKVEYPDFDPLEVDLSTFTSDRRCRSPTEHRWMTNEITLDDKSMARSRSMLQPHTVITF